MGDFIMAKLKHSLEWILARVDEYLSGKVSYQSISWANGISSTTLKMWVLKYREQGKEAFIRPPGNARYSKEFKLLCVESVLQGKLSVLIAKHFLFHAKPSISLAFPSSVREKEGGSMSYFQRARRIFARRALACATV